MDQAMPDTRRSRDRQLAGAAERIAATSATAEELLRRAVRRVRRAVPADGWCALTLDPSTLLKTGGVHEAGLSPAASLRMFALEYAAADVNQFAELARRPSPVADLDQSTERRPESSPRFRELLAPAGYRHEVRVVLREGGLSWGGLALLRRPGTGRFTTAERRLLAAVSAPLAAGLRRLVLRGAAGDPEGAAGGAVESGLLLLGPDFGIAEITPAARRLLGGADLPWPPVPVAAVAARASRVPETVSAPAPSPAGGWLTVTGWRLDAGRLAVTVQTARSEQMAALVLDAYRLSPRERQVTELLLRGHSTAEIASALFLSAYTVQDHLRAVFDKTGVRSRRALIARLLPAAAQPPG